MHKKVLILIPGENKDDSSGKIIEEMVYDEASKIHLFLNEEKGILLFLNKETKDIEVKTFTTEDDEIVNLYNSNSFFFNSIGFDFNRLRIEVENLKSSIKRMQIDYEDFTRISQNASQILKIQDNNRPYNNFFKKGGKKNKRNWRY